MQGAQTPRQTRFLATELNSFKYSKNLYFYKGFIIFSIKNLVKEINECLNRIKLMTRWRFAIKHLYRVFCCSNLIKLIYYKWNGSCTIKKTEVSWAHAKNQRLCKASLIYTILSTRQVFTWCLSECLLIPLNKRYGGSLGL